MYEYHKIETIYARDTGGSRKLMFGDWRDPTVEYLADLDWVWTEKIDGTNIRVIWDGYSVEIKGRTDKTEIPKHLLDRLTEIFGTSDAEQLFEQAFGSETAVLYGEGYGKKVQKNGEKYIPDGCDFILFDVFAGGEWKYRYGVRLVAEMFGVAVVPVVGRGPLRDAVKFVQAHPQSEVGTHEHEMEGLVCRPLYEMRDNRGERIIVKIKYKDFKDVEEDKND